MTSSRAKNLILWIKQGDPPSERAQLGAKSWGRILPPDIALQVCLVDVAEPEVSRVPCLHFRLDEEVVYSLEGDITLDAVIGVLRRLG
jgi:hypothetical protein